MSEGAHVFISGRRQKELDEAVAAAGGESIVGIRNDVSDLDDLDRLYERIREEAGRLDILFVNAGGGEFMPLRAITEAHFDRIIATNVKGTLFTVQKALPLMGRGSSIILTGSTAAVSGTPAFSVYAASKAAIHSFARNWILDLKGSGIRVNVLAPGSTSTPGWHGLAPTKEFNRDMVRTVEAATPLDDWARRRKSLRQRFFLLQTKAVSSPVPNTSLMEVWLRYSYIYALEMVLGSSALRSRRTAVQSEP